jgi:hypothetical protein
MKRERKFNQQSELASRQAGYTKSFLSFMVPFIVLGLNSGPVLAMPWPEPCSLPFLHFSDRVSCFCLGLASDHDPCTSTSCVVGITDVNHLAQFIL